MKKIGIRFWIHGILGAFFLLLMLAFARPAGAQEVVGISEILNSTTSSEIDTYSATWLDYSLLADYDPYVEAYLYENNSLIHSGAADYDANGPNDNYAIAEGGFTDPLTVGDIYTVLSGHWVVAYYYDQGYGYYNPDQFLYYTGNGEDPSGTGYTDGGGPLYYDSEYIYIGETGVQMSSAPPVVTSYSPGAASVGTSGSITIDGTDLVDVFTGETTPAITGTGMSVSIVSQSSTEVVLNYSISSGASTGEHDITLSTRFGASNAASFNAGDPTPVVTGVNPSVWPAGSSFDVTITGSGFGTNPLVSLSGVGVAINSQSGASDTQVTVNVSVAADAPSENVTVQVQSTGYLGNGFMPTQTGQPSASSNTATVAAILAPKPAILLYGQPVANPQSLTAGQQVALSATVSVPAGLSISSQSWSAPPGIAVGRYANADGTGPPDTTGGQILPLPSNQVPSFAFYWLDGGNSRTITYSYTLNNGQSNSATATFDVDAPSGIMVGAPPNEEVQSAVNIIVPTGQQVPLLAAQDNDNPGINLLASASHLPAGGQYQWVQLLSEIVEKVIGPNASQTCTAVSPSGAPMLDNSYPYGAVIGTVTTSTVSNDGANDSPSALLSPQFGELAESFSARMFLMFLPPVPNGCSNGAACTIPVPLGSFSWRWSGDAINTRQPGDSGLIWNKNFAGNSNGGFLQDHVFPTWRTTFANGGVTCQ